MRYQDKVTIQAPRQQVWEFLVDPDQVAQCAPGVETVEVLEENKKFKVIASIGFGNLKVRFNTDVEFTEQNPPELAKIKAHGTAPGSVVDVLADLALSEVDANTTDLDWAADINVMGTIAALANRMMGSVTNKLAGQFFESVKTKVEK